MRYFSKIHTNVTDIFTSHKCFLFVNFTQYRDFKKIITNLIYQSTADNSLTITNSD